MYHVSYIDTKRWDYFFTFWHKIIIIITLSVLKGEHYADTSALDHSVSRCLVVET